MRADQATSVSADTFVSMRIGQVQRHARFAPVRNYKFDGIAASDKSPVKLEVFKRIGATTVTFGGSTGDIQDIEVPVTDGKPMRMRLTSSSARVTTPGRVEKKKAKDVNDARNYLAEHNLESLIKDAMKELMNVKPANPHEYLARYILNAGQYSNGLLPKIYGGGKDLDGMPVGGKSRRQTEGKNLPRNLPPLSGSASMPELHKPKEIRKGPDPYQVVLPKRGDFGHCTSAGTWCVKKPPQIEITEEMKTRILEEQVPKYNALEVRPSVGTWHMPLPHEAPADETNYRKWNLRPSAGTWVANKMSRSLEELTHWEPSMAETQAMTVILGGRKKEIDDLSEKLREVQFSLERAKTSGSGDVGKMESTIETLERCLSCAQNEYEALEMWGTRRGFSQPSSPVTSPAATGASWRM